VATSRGANTLARSFLAVLILFFIFSHLPFSSSLAAELTSDFEAGASSFNREFPFHFNETRLRLFQHSHYLPHRQRFFFMAKSPLKFCRTLTSHLVQNYWGRSLLNIRRFRPEGIRSCG
jgi:hypothetical protein